MIKRELLSEGAALENHKDLRLTIEKSVVLSEGAVLKNDDAALLPLGLRGAGRSKSGGGGTPRSPLPLHRRPMLRFLHLSR